MDARAHAQRERARVHEPRKRCRQGGLGPSSGPEGAQERRAARSAQAVNVVEVRVNGLILEHKSQQNIVILRESEGERILPIWIGPGEAQAIRRILSEEAFPRPLTHDLIHIVIEGLKAKVTRGVIADLREKTFYASIFLERQGGVRCVER